MIKPSSNKLAFCTGCGTCVGMCPKGALRMKRNLQGLYAPTLDSSRCDGCGLCTKVCAGRFVDLQANRSDAPVDRESGLIGPFVGCYVGHSTDEGIRRESTSGGLATELAALALESKLVDGVVVTKMRDKSPLEPESFLARSREELLEASKSKYCPVSLNVVLHELLRCDGKFAIIGLPCHIHGVEKAKRAVSELRSRLILSLGLFCGHTTTFVGTEFLLEKLGIRKRAVANLTYRGKRWPPRMTVELHNGEKSEMLLSDYWDLFLSNFFIPVRCTVCPDFANELADVSLGDAWLPKFSTKDQGYSLVVTRTRIGQNILLEALKRNRVKAECVSPFEVIESARKSVNFKKKGLTARIAFLRAFGYRIPDIMGSYLEPNVASYFAAALAFLNIGISSNHKAQKLLRYMPHIVLDAYSKAINGIRELH